VKQLLATAKAVPYVWRCAEDTRTAERLYLTGDGVTRHSLLPEAQGSLYKGAPPVGISAKFNIGKEFFDP
jgi:hypothetical protein